MNIAQLLAQASAMGLDRLDAQLLLLHALGRRDCDRTWLSAHDTDEVGDLAWHAFLRMVARRGAGEPLAYIVGRKEFFGLDLMVDARVLVPRPDTETLVEWALELLGSQPRLDPGSTAPAEAPWIAGQARNDSTPRVLDLGTGSGAIALAIKKHQPQAVVEAIDASGQALAVAIGNAQALSLDVRFRQASWLAGTSSRYDLIVSNPPYVADGDRHLAALKHEPLQALAAGPDGLREIREIVSQARARLRPGGWLLLEHGFDQAAAVRRLLAAAGFQRVASRSDLAGIERCSGGARPELG